MSFQESRIAFGPEALSRFTLILEEVMVDLIGDGVPAALVRSIEVRTRLSQRLLGFARLWWTDSQIKQLLLRALRNEISAGKYAGVQAAARASNRMRMAGWRYVLPTSVSINLKQPGEYRFEFLSRRPEKKDREPSACAAVGLMTGSDDTVLDNVSVH